MIYPILLWAVAAMFVHWDAVKARTLNVKATYTITDMISCQPDPVDEGLGNDIRVSAVRNVHDPDTETERLELR